MKRFRDDRLAYIGTKEKQYQDLLIRQFKGRHKEVGSLLSLLSGRLNDKDIVHQLGDKLRRLDIPAARQTLEQVRFMQHRIKGYRLNVPYAAYFYPSLLAELNTFLSLMDSFREKVLESLLYILEVVNSEKNTSKRHIYEEDISSISTEIRAYSNLIGKYYDYFSLLLRKESCEPAIAVIAPAGEMLLRLTRMIEKISIGAEDTLYFMSKWKIKLNSRELQEAYN